MFQKMVWGSNVRDEKTGDVGKVVRVSGDDVQIWLFQSDATVWRFGATDKVEVITPSEYEQACYEWEIREEPTVEEAFQERGEAGDFDPQM